MIFQILIAIFSIVILFSLHELGHFILAKVFGVRVQEFGLGYPPRIFGKTIGQTFYSLNLLPFGAFVRVYGEEEGVMEGGSFRTKPIWQRALIVLGGVITFWIIAFLLFTLVAGVWGLPVAVEDEINHDLKDTKIQIIEILPNSPAERAELKSGDIIKKIESGGDLLETDKVAEVVEFVKIHQGREVVLTIKRGGEVLEIVLVPRVSPPENEGPMGVSLTRTALEHYSWREAPLQGILTTGRVTIAIPRLLGDALIKSFRGEQPREQIELKGPVGVAQLIGEIIPQGINYFLYFMAIIAIHAALFNLLPIPAVDGGRLLFLGIEKIKGGPLDPKTEKNVNAFFFTLLIILMVFVTIKDIKGLL
ncbi:hypothetical protein AMJ50_01475 [Parcubacteria bacterium DG_74_3]|nr:MAG: hypothetical protein AMJ50_01475 [Parcubacteria bacterium DG_74_3]